LDVHNWTIRDEVRMTELIQIGVEGIITDLPDRPLDLIGRAAKRPGDPTSVAFRK
jgi:glycerophosphoryl diester phosphodiesterase